MSWAGWTRDSGALTLGPAGFLYSRRTAFHIPTVTFLQPYSVERVQQNKVGST